MGEGTEPATHTSVAISALSELKVTNMLIFSLSGSEQTSQVPNIPRLDSSQNASGLLTQSHPSD